MSVGLETAPAKYSTAALLSARKAKLNGFPLTLVERTSIVKTAENERTTQLR